MVLEWLDYQLDGNSWEKLCISICRIKYSNDNFQAIPANKGGDGGIEGFTKSNLGIVIQCYCPDDVNIDDEKLYNKQRDKITEDIKKLIKNSKLLRELGVQLIKEWHFMVPKMTKDKNLLKHCEKKRKEVLNIKKSEPENFCHISDDFIIVIKVAEDFKAEIARLIRTDKIELVLDIPDISDEKINWSAINSDKSDNIRRKVKAILPEATEHQINDAVDYQIKKIYKGK